MNKPHKTQTFHLFLCSSCRPTYTYGFVYLGAFTGTQTILEYKDSNYPLIAPCQE